MIIDDVMTDKITLHGLGFVQVQLEGGQRLHVWHPELPRRACFKYSAIHDHRFNFTSRVIIGKQIITALSWSAATRRLRVVSARAPAHQVAAGRGRQTAART